MLHNTEKKSENQKKSCLSYFKDSITTNKVKYIEPMNDQIKQTVHCPRLTTVSKEQSATAVFDILLKNLDNHLSAGQRGNNVG